MTQQIAQPAAAADFYFNPIDLAFRDNPYPHYPKLLEGPPRKFTLFMPVTLAARYEDCAAILRDHERFSNSPPRNSVVDMLRKQYGPFAGAPTMLDSDPPVHTRLRRLVSRAFTPRRVKDMEGRIREIARGLLDSAERAGGFDAMTDLANPLPVIVIAEMLGVPPEEHAQFKQWSNGIIEGGQLAFRAAAPGEGLTKSTQELRAYLTAQIERRRREPGEDLITALVHAHDEGGSLDADELLAFVVLLLLAGNETTTNLIGNGLLLLARHPEQQQRLRQSPELLSKAVEEILRYDPPVQMTVRTPIRATEVGGTEITLDSLVFVLIAAANRDPAQFPHPEVFDIGRSPNEHLSFGGGIHFCLGAPLSRLEGAIAIEAVLKKYARLTLAVPDEKLEYRGSI